MKKQIILYRAEDETTVIRACDNSGATHKRALHSFENIALDHDDESKPNKDTMKRMQDLYSDKIISLMVRTGIPQGKLWQGTSKKMELIDVLHFDPNN